MEANAQLNRRIHNATIAILPAELQVQVTPRGRGAAAVPVFDIAVSTATGEHHLVGGWAGEGWPADVERLVCTAADVDVVYAKTLSAGAREWLSGRHIGWVDETRQARIIAPSGLVISLEPRSVEQRASLQDRWTGMMLAAAEAILAGIAPTVEAIEAATGMSRGSAAGVLSRLERRGLLDRPPARRGKGVARRIANVDTFIDEYAKAAGEFRAKQPVVLVHRLWTDPLEALAKEMGPALVAAAVTWAVTGAAASTLLAPYLGNVTIVELYVERDLFVSQERLARLLGGRAVEKGHRIEVRELPTSLSADGPDLGGIHVALPARVYADLMAAGGRSAEAAHHLREVRGVGPRS